jgi:tRNA G18 (ribose-2'-O)-methylase SpoU
MLVEVDDLDDKRLAPYRDLKQQGAAARAGLFITEGDKLTRRLLVSPLAVHSLLVGRSHLPRLADRLPAETPVYVVPDDAVERIIGFNFHRGVLGCGIRPRPQSVDDLLAPWATRLPPGDWTLVVCAGIQDPENLGSILRTAGALGADGAVLAGGCADPYSRRVLRVSMGTVFRLPLAREADPAAVLERLAGGYDCQTWATVLDAEAEPLDTLARPSRLAVLLGGEGHGLDAHLAANCQRRVTIPMQPGIDSLNVSVAAGIVLYHILQSEKP